MGVQDRDWWRQAQRERERREALEPPGMDRTVRRGAFAMVLVWLLVAAVLYALFSQIEQRREAAQQAQLAAFVGEGGELVIPRSPDGHFRLPGSVNGEPVLFLVDTGASLVTVSEAVAQRAGLRGGQPVVFQTANGPLQGRVLNNVSVAAGPLALQDVRVGVGLVADDQRMALLGQSFLARFHIELSADRMVVRVKGRES